jgi:hypothetical protein
MAADLLIATRSTRARAGLRVSSVTLLGPRLRLVCLSFLMLFLELALIRWTAANNVHLTYLTNFVLLASFLGVGLGFLRADRDPDLFPWTPIALAALVAFVLAFPVELRSLRGPQQLRGAFGMAALPLWPSLGCVFLLTVATMAAIGQGLARTFVRFPPLEAYRLDILGSLAGIAAFTGISFLWLPPIAWGAAASMLLALLLGRRWQLIALLPVLVLLAIESSRANEHWSPYYKVTAVYSKQGEVAGVPTHGVLAISANGVPHQTAYPVATLARIERFYFFPYRHLGRTRLRDVLIVGAGSGNDVAVALQEGARHIDAVEIDPVIQHLGSQLHPDRPYRNPRVSVHIDDGRAYIENTHRRYDLILFALPDSLTLLAGQSNLRLENYLFTLESMRQVRSLLKPGGTFAMYNYYEPWLLDRYAGTLERVYGRAPCVEIGDSLGGRDQAVLAAGAGASLNCRSRWHGRRLSAPTDDHPFPYLQHNAIPTFYLEALGAMLAASLILVRLGVGSFRRMAAYADLGFMGAAFLLLETKNVVQFALLFGTTWLVNALVFAGVLLSVYLAIEVARRLRLPRPSLLYSLLLAALAVAWIVPQESLLSLSPGLRFVAAVALAFAPIFLANLVFAHRFRQATRTATAFAANLLGAMIGGLLEYLSLLTGYHFLLLVVAALYTLALLTSRAIPRLAASS